MLAGTRHIILEPEMGRKNVICTFFRARAHPGQSHAARGGKVGRCTFPSTGAGRESERAQKYSHDVEKNTFFDVFSAHAHIQRNRRRLG